MVSGMVGSAEPVDREGITRMTDEQALGRPIGWWLKEADARLDATFERTLRGSAIDRRGWQVLNSLARRPTSRTELVASLASFDEPAVVQGVVAEMQDRLMVEEAAGLLQLTPSGARKQADLAPLVDGVRQQISAALPQEDYITLVRLLARLTEAL